MYFQYIKERLNLDSLQYDDKAFIVFKQWIEEDAIFIQDLYVAPSHRRSGFTQKIYKDMCSLAKEANHRYLIGAIESRSNNPELSMGLMLHLGFKIYRTQESMIYLRKEI